MAPLEASQRRERTYSADADHLFRLMSITMEGSIGVLGWWLGVEVTGLGLGGVES